MNHRHKGFTIIELLVVISIIGLLSSIATFALGNARKQARDNRRIQDLKQIQTALELYYKDNQKYPRPNSLDGYTTNIGTGAGHCLNRDGTKWGNQDDYIEDLEAGKYISNLPLDPRFDVNGTDPGAGGDSKCYVYTAFQDTITRQWDYKIVAFGVMESLCGTDPSDTCNPQYIQALDDPKRPNHPTIAIYSSEKSRLW